VARGKDHERHLKELRAKALPMTPEARELVAQRQRLLEEEAKEKDYLARARKADSRGARRRIPQVEAMLARLAKSLSELEAKIDTSRWRFSDYEDRFQHSIVTDLVAKVAQVARVLPSVTALRARAATLRIRSIEDRREDWARAAEAIQAADDQVASSRYAGLPRLKPQLGLVPIGMDPASKLWEFAVLDSGVVPVRGEHQKLEIDADSAMVLVYLPGGTFLMGVQTSDPNAPNYHREGNERIAPVNTVTIDPFFLSKYEMTQAQWLRLMGSG